MINAVERRDDRIVASQMKQGNNTEQYRPSPSNAPDDSGTYKFSAMNRPYAAPNRRQTSGVATANTSAVTPYNVSYTAIGSVVRYTYGCVASARTSAAGAPHGEPPG